ncbi:lipoprotein signal peptidase [Owenweeksia hongkongensis]|uniref:Lipoprotein signal peptidase n=1 Tax=Owenweeksia hongkongensis (strain DSM 17368 / CIP 108786 / JCM 12287 / NRRL B-23963 / UST20020801) TaxID=926562 RepID=G8R8E2_OWEHD|nr:lipoprotein signal peptidase [Owenweeksia hongkongensis]AEV33535.1 lipoprotein signal peptidase [Owenweeksia hongkongensis DSM 17368]
MKRAALIVSLVLLVDQISKIWIKTNMFLGQEYKITDWFIIHFTENPGMAFGMELGGDYGKLILTLFRIVVVGGIFYWLRGMIKENAKPVAITAVSLVLAGAIGNIIDSVFYGVFFNESYGQLATFMPAEGGYAGWFHGRVVDMLYFPLFRGYLPDWIPFWGGDYFVFFRPIFNIADTAISVGVGLLLLFQKHIFKK